MLVSKMRKLSLVIPLVVLLVISLVLSGCGSANVPSSSNSKAQPNEPYKIGILTTLSGPNGFLGVDIRDAAQLEVDAINAKGGINGHPMELVVEDDGMDPGKAVSAFTKLVKQDKVLAVTGVTFTFIEPALRPVAEREQITLIHLNPLTPELRARKDKYTFNIATSEFNRVGAWLDMLKEKGYTRVVGISQNDPLCIASIDELKKEAPAQGITVDNLPDFINVTDVDVTPQVAKLKDLIAKVKPQVIVSTVWPPNLPAVLKTMKQMGVEIPVIEFDGAADGSMLKMGGDELNGLMLNGAKVLAGAALPDSDPQKTVIVDFKNRFEVKTGRLAGNQAAGAYDAIHMIANALKVAGTDKTKIRDSIENTKNFVGITGVFNFSADSHEGLTKDSYAVYEIKDKKFNFLYVIKK